MVLDLSKRDICQLSYKEKQNNIDCCFYGRLKKMNASQSSTKIKNDLKSDLENKALFNESLSDFTFIISDEKIPVCKTILSARSPVFYKLFNNELKETNSQDLQTKIPAVAFKELIRYIYAERVCNLSTHVFGLLQAAVIYQVDGLKEICENELLACLSNNNAQYIFQIAHMYECSIKLKTASFIEIKKIFKNMNLTVPDEFVNSPIKVFKLFEKKKALEMELLVPLRIPIVAQKPVKRLNLKKEPQ